MQARFAYRIARLRPLDDDRMHPRKPVTLGPLGKGWAWGGLRSRRNPRREARSATVRVRFPVVAPLHFIADTPLLLLKASLLPAHTA